MLFGDSEPTSNFERVHRRQVVPRLNLVASSVVLRDKVEGGAVDPISFNNVNIPPWPGPCPEGTAVKLTIRRKIPQVGSKRSPRGFIDKQSADVMIRLRGVVQLAAGFPRLIQVDERQLVRRWELFNLGFHDAAIGGTHSRAHIKSSAVTENGPFIAIK